MLRNLAYHTLTILASLIILAHAVIPHHHHSDRVCFDLTVCFDPQDPSGHHHHADCCENNHQTDHTQQEKQQNPSDHGSSECCHLVEMLVFHPVPQRNELSCPAYDVKHNDYTPLPYLKTIDQVAPVPHQVIVTLQYKSAFIGYPPESAVVTPGLRAPPAC